MADSVLEMDGVTRFYRRSLFGVRNLSLRLERGTCYGLLGRNGSGKTTTLRLAMGMLRPESGTVRLFGHDPFREPEAAKVRVGYLAEDQDLPDVLRPVDLFRAFATFHPSWDPALERELTERFAVPAGRRLAEMSRGQKRAAGLICAVAHRPELLILDEPGGGLDPVVRRDMLETVVGLLGDAGTTVLFSSHNLVEVERVADRVGILSAGGLLLERNLESLKEDSCRVLVRGDGIRKDSIAGCIRVESTEGTSTLTLLCGSDEARSRLRQQHGLEAIQVQPVTLEDLFVALVGGGS
jgi:ABC-2 type transport system ATP-binding protein